MPLFYHICLVKHFYGKGNLNCIIYGLYYHLGLNIIKTCIPSFKILFTHSEYLKIGFFTPTHFWKKTECMDITSMKPFTKILNFMAPGWRVLQCWKNISLQQNCFIPLKSFFSFPIYICQNMMSTNSITLFVKFMTPGTEVMP